jgi:hypothetical protein
LKYPGKRPPSQQYCRRVHADEERENLAKLLTRFAKILSKIQ